MLAFTIRRAEASDLPDLGRLGASLMAVHHGFDPRRFMAPGDRPEDGYASFLGSQLQDEDAAVFVAVRDGRVAGYVYAGLEPLSWKELRDAAGFVHDVIVASDSRGLGIASALMEAALVWLKSRGAPRAILWTATANASAQAVFDQLGFRRTMIEMVRELD